MAGAILKLLREGGVVAQGLTNEAGVHSFRGVAAGTYRVRADRIGYPGLLSEPVLVEPNRVREFELLMPSTPANLPTVEVRGATRCQTRDGTGTLAAALWVEVEKALTANILTQRTEAPVRFIEFEREVSLGGRPGHEWVTGTGIIRGAPFTSLAPGHLADQGFVAEVGDSTRYAVPDAALLLSPEFVATHCFRAAKTKARDSLAGLTFVPVPGRRVSDVKGTLWVHRATRELRHLEFEYVGLAETTADPDRVIEGLGGRVEYLRLASGRWIVGGWYVRMPRTTTREVRAFGHRQSETHLVGYLDRGGRAGRVLDSAAIRMTTIAGRVFDSLTMHGLAGATVWIEGLPDSARTDAEGRFALMAPSAGLRTVRARHAKLLLSGEPPSVDIASLGDSVAVGFETPSAETIARNICGPARGSATVIGLVPPMEPAARPEVEAVTRTPAGAVSVSRGYVRPSGFFALCEVPIGLASRVRVLDGLRPLQEVRIRVDAGEIRWLDFRAAGAEAAVTGGAERSGAAVLHGVVRSATTSAPVIGAEVFVENGGARTLTGPDGRYRLDSLPTGRRIVRYRAVGYRAVRQTVLADPGDTLEVDQELVAGAVELAPLEVTARPRDAPGVGLDGFQGRRRLGFGQFYGPDDLRRRNDIALGQFLGGSGRRVFPVSARRVGPQGEVCYMTVYYEGALIYRSPGPPGTDQAERSATTEPIDLNTIPVADLEAVEVYRSAAEVPPEYGGASAACGVILLWRRRGP